MRAVGPTGVGVGLRRPHVQALLATDRRVDWLELTPENYLGRGGGMSRHLDACLERWPVLVHGVTASIGGPDPYDDGWLDALRRFLARVRAPFYSDHLCWTSAGGFQSHQLLPLPFHREAIDHAVGRIRALRDALRVPIAVENISFYAVMPGSDLGFAAFEAAVVEEADCGLLLDLNNLYVNARNFGLDPMEVLDRYPLDRVWQVHLAGHELQHGRYIDTHGAPVAPEVQALYVALVERIGPVPALLERDTNLPPLAEVLDEADALRRLIEPARDVRSVLGPREPGSWTPDDRMSGP
ncbi:MAG: DUF692 domain-containing protein [Myxococcota bacterium]